MSRTAALAVMMLLASSTPASAAGDRAAPSQSRVAQDAGTRDFFFGRPRGWLGLRGTWLVPRAGGDLFRFVSDQLTIDPGDFSTGAMTAEAGFLLTTRLGAAGGVEFSRQSVPSEYRRFVDNRGQPIAQQTTLTQVNLSGSLVVSLIEPGRTISRLAFVPRAFTPYVGGGAGLFFYRFRQDGDFVDFVTLRVFPDVFQSQGWTPSAHLFGGADIRIWRLLFADVEARYVWAHGDLGSDFIGFDGIDLDGVRVSSGVRIVF